MSLFIVATTETDTNAILKSRIPEQFSDNYYEIGNGLWVVSFDGTAKGLFEEKLEDADNKLVGCIVFRITSYWGRYSSDMWEWIDAMKAGGKRA